MQEKEFAVGNLISRVKDRTSEGMQLNLKSLRNDRGWTLDYVAELSGTSKGYLSQLENGRRQPSTATLETLAEVFRVRVIDLVASGAPSGRSSLDAQISAELQRLGEREKAVILATARAMRAAAPGAGD